MKISELAEKHREPAPWIGAHAHGDLFGHFVFPSPVGGNRFLRVVACSAGKPWDDWDHVSVTLVNSQNTPTWAEMCFVKEQFWDDEETVVQFHPKKSEYRNHHPGCLHLWKNVRTNHELPPAIMVAP